MNPTQNSILRISDQKTLEFLGLYEKEECLWNTSVPDHKNKVKRQHAAERIAEKLDIKHFSSKHVILKFRNLRCSYAQELKKIANSEAAGDDPVYRPKVIWYSKIEFVRPHIQLYKATKYPPSRKASTQSEEEEDMIHEVKIEYEDTFSYEENELESYEPQEKRLKTILPSMETRDDNNDSNISNPVSLKDTSCQTLLIPRILNPLGDSSSHPVVMTRIPDPLGDSSSRPLMTHQSDDHFKHVDKCKAIKNMPQDVKPWSSTEPPKEPRIEDCFDSFGNYVAAMLKNMPVQRAMELQPEIVKMLVSAIINNKEDLNNLPDHEKS